MSPHRTLLRIVHTLLGEAASAGRSFGRLEWPLAPFDHRPATLPGWRAPTAPVIEFRRHVRAMTPFVNRHPA